MIDDMLAAHVTMVGLYMMLDDLVAQAERTYCASGKADDKRQWDKLMQSRAALKLSSLQRHLQRRSLTLTERLYDHGKTMQGLQVASTRSPLIGMPPLPAWSTAPSYRRDHGQAVAAGY